jgi:hypothetical protein
MPAAAAVPSPQSIRAVKPAAVAVTSAEVKVATATLTSGAPSLPATGWPWDSRVTSVRVSSSPTVVVAEAKTLSK